jgi:hypothetical protein
MTSSMATPSIPFRVHHLNTQPNSALSEAIESGLALLMPHSARIEHCDVHVGCWVQHHSVGRSYRVVIELEPREDAVAFSMECESAPNPSREVLVELVRDAFARTARRLAAREQLNDRFGTPEPVHHHSHRVPLAAGLRYAPDER